MATEQIPTGLIADDAVTTAKVADDAITGALIENNPTIAGNLTISGTTTATGAFTASGGIANAGTITAGTLGSSVVSPASIGSSLVLLNTTTISSAVANVNFDNTLITTTYNSYKILIEGLSSSADDFDLDIQVSRNNGTSFVSSRSSHNWIGLNASSEGFVHNETDFTMWRDVEGVDAESGGNGGVEIVLSDDAALLDCAIASWSCVKNQNGDFYAYMTRGVTTSNSSADRVNYLRFKCSGGAGNLDKGTFRLYGYKKS